MARVRREPSGTPYRPIIMTRTRRKTRLLTVAAPTLVLAVLLTACGSEGDSEESDTRGEDSAQTSEPQPESRSSDSGDDSEDGSGSSDSSSSVELIHQSAVGGHTGDPVVLDSQSAIDDFVSQFTRDEFAEKVARAAQSTKVAEGQQLFGAVVSVGCDVPPGVNVSVGDKVEITAQKVADPLQECYVPVTTVALVTVDAPAAE